MAYAALMHSVARQKGAVYKPTPLNSNTTYLKLQKKSQNVILSTITSPRCQPVLLSYITFCDFLHRLGATAILEGMEKCRQCFVHVDEMTVVSQYHSSEILTI